MKKLMLQVVMLLLVSAICVRADSGPTNPYGGIDANTALGSDEIVIACTRNYPGTVGRTLDWSTFHGFGYAPEVGRWSRPVPLIGPAAQRETWVFVHGNQIPPAEAIRRGLRVYRELRTFADLTRPIRFVIWSWPSEREKSRLADARIKTKRTDAESFYLGSYLNRVAAQASVRVIAYSFGARIASGGLHLASGGRIEGRYLADCQPALTPYRVAFLAAAVGSNGFGPGGRYCAALSNVEQLLLHNNSKDQALRFFWIVNRGDPKALGAVGLKCNPSRAHVQQYDWSRWLGSDHSIWRYFEQPMVRERINQILLAP